MTDWQEGGDDAWRKREGEGGGVSGEGGREVVESKRKRAIEVQERKIGRARAEKGRRQADAKVGVRF